MSATNPKETVDHPPHYGGDTTYETIKVIEAWGLDFALGNCVKYISRAGRKDPEALLEDLHKAAWYLQHEIERLTPGDPMAAFKAAGISTADLAGGGR